CPDKRRSATPCHLCPRSFPQKRSRRRPAGGPTGSRLPTDQEVQMLRPVCLFILMLTSCDLLFIDNPANCVRNPNTCGQDTYCNLDTQNCETLDCTVNTGLCASTSFCDPMTRRCAVKDCSVDATLCTATQLCNLLTRQCQTRTFVIGQPDVM